MAKRIFSTDSMDRAVKSKTTKHVDFATQKEAGQRGELEVGAGVEHDGEKVDIEASVNVRTDFTKKKTSVTGKGSIKWQ